MEFTGDALVPVDGFKAGDVLWTSFKIGGSVGPEAWGPQIQPIDVVRIGHIKDEVIAPPTYEEYPQLDRPRLQLGRIQPPSNIGGMPAYTASFFVIAYEIIDTPAASSAAQPSSSSVMTVASPAKAALETDKDTNDVSETYTTDGEEVLRSVDRSEDIPLVDLMQDIDAVSRLHSHLGALLIKEVLHRPRITILLTSAKLPLILVLSMRTILRLVLLWTQTLNL